MRLAEFVVRPARREDFPAIRALIWSVRINPFGLDWRRFLVAVSPSGEVLGCGQIKLHRRGVRELASIAVRPEARRQGVARAIIEALVRQEAHRPLYLMCRASLEGFYARFGFQTVAQQEMPPYFRRLVCLVNGLRLLGFRMEELRIMRLD